MIVATSKRNNKAKSLNLDQHSSTSTKSKSSTKLKQDKREKKSSIVKLKKIGTKAEVVTAPTNTSISTMHHITNQSTIQAQQLKFTSTISMVSLTAVSSLSFFDKIILDYIDVNQSERDVSIELKVKYLKYRLEIQRAIILYTTKVVNVSKMKQLLKMLTSSEFKCIKNSFIGNYDILIKLKFAIINCSFIFKAQNDIANFLTEARKCFTNYKLTFQDDLMNLLLKHKDLIDINNIAVEHEVNSNLTLAQIENECLENINKIKKSLYYRVKYKLRFIYSANNLYLEDFLQELIEQSVKSYYLSTPYITNGHALNSMRLSAVNHSNNIIKYYTTNKRQRLSNKGEEGFENKIISMMVSPLSSEYKNGEAESIFNIIPDQKSIDLQKETEILMVVDNLFDHFRKTGKKTELKVLKLLLGYPDKKFFKYCKQQAEFSRYKTQSDLLDSVNKTKYFLLIRKYLKISKQLFTTIALEIRQELINN